jgi:hypothetical protein
MAKLPTLVSATIVLIFTMLIGSATAWSTPQNTVPDPKPSEETENFNPLPEDMQIAKPPGQTPELKTSRARYYPYEQQLTFRVGKSAASTGGQLDNTLIGFQYLFPKFLSPKLEAGADLHEEAEGHLHVGMRWIYHERSYFRPSAKASGDILLKSDERLATFSKIDNYFIRGTATLEYVAWNPYSIRLEYEVYLGMKDQLFAVSIGVSRGW